MTLDSPDHAQAAADREALAARYRTAVKRARSISLGVIVLAATAIAIVIFIDSMEAVGGPANLRDYIQALVAAAFFAGLTAAGLLGIYIKLMPSIVRKWFSLFPLRAP